MPPAETAPRLPFIAALGLLTAPYLLNDFANIYVHTPMPWLACDYGARVFSLACLAWLVRRRVIAWGDLQLGGAAWWRLAGGTLAATAIGLLLNTYAARDFFGRLTDTQWGFIPDIAPPWLHQFDNVFGIGLTALSEELIFRGACPRLIARAGGPPAVALLGSAVMFGLAHWSLGVGAIVQTALIGVIFALGVRFSRSLWPVIVAHYVIDLYVFG